MSLRVLLTGSAGFIGSHTAENLLREGHSVLGVDNFDPFYDKSLKLSNLEAIRKTGGDRFEFHSLDFTDPAQMEALNAQADVVIHLGAKAGVRPSLLDPAGYVRANLTGTVNVLEWARRRGIRHVLFGSSSSVYGNTTPVPFKEDALADHPFSPYAATKRSGELLCETWSQLYSMRITSLRFFTVYGPRQRPDLAIRQFTRKIMNEEKITLFGDGTTERDYTHVSDIVRGLMAAMKYTIDAPEKGHEIFNLGGHHAISLHDLVSKLSTYIGKPARLEWQGMQPGDVTRTWADVSKSKKLLGYNPQMKLDDGLKDFVQWYRKEGQGL